MRRLGDSGVGLVVAWTLEDLLFSPRTLAMGAVALSPAALALVYRLVTAAGFDPPYSGSGFFSLLTATLGFQFVAPMLSLFYSSGVVSDEIDSGRLTYFLSRPQSRAHWLAGKMIGGYLIQALLFLPPLVLGFYLAVAPAGWGQVGLWFPSLARDAWAALLGLAAYSGLFAFLGVVLRRPVLAGLVFVFGWQAAATYVPGAVRHLTVAYYLQSLLPHGSPPGGLARLLGSPPSPAVSTVVLLAVALGAHALAMLSFSRKELPGKV